MVNLRPHGIFIGAFTALWAVEWPFASGLLAFPCLAAGAGVATLIVETYLRRLA
jgi:hypothetical protein